MKKNLTLPTLACISLVAASAGAATMTFDTGAISLGGQTVDAEAIVTTGAGTVTVTLRNLEADPTAVIQNISGFGFTLSGGLGAGSSLSSSSGLERTVAANGSFHDGSSVSTGWTLNNLFLNGLGGAANTPAHTIIGGPGGGGTYDLANSSIAGNGPHNPFLAGDVTFTISLSGVNSDTTISGPIFQFGTSGDQIGVPDGGTTVLLLGAALSGLGMLRRKLS